MNFNNLTMQNVRPPLVVVADTFDGLETTKPKRKRFFTMALCAALCAALVGLCIFLSYREKELPPEARLLIGGESVLVGGFVFDDFYNGSDWTVTRVAITITVHGQDGAIRWTRKLARAVNVKPFSVMNIPIPIGEQGLKEGETWTWDALDVYGHKAVWWKS